MTEREALEALAASLPKCGCGAVATVIDIPGDRWCAKCLPPDDSNGDAPWAKPYHDAKRILATPPAPATRDSLLEGAAARVVSAWDAYDSFTTPGIAMEQAVKALDIALRGEPEPAAEEADEALVGCPTCGWTGGVPWARRRDWVCGQCARRARGDR